MIPDKYKSNHLFLLIGTNPLPNYVAARLLLLSPGFLYLLHTKETKPIAERLRLGLRRHLSGVEMEYVEIDSTDNVKIRDGIASLLKNRNLNETGRKTSSVGLHYTGGTAAMSVHSYAAFELFFKESLVSVVYSYLDARTLSMRFDGHGGALQDAILVGELCNITVDEIVRLHGFASSAPSLVRAGMSAARKEMLKSIAEVRSTVSGNKAWNEYVKNLISIPSDPLLTTFTRQIKAQLGDNPTDAQVARWLDNHDRFSSCQTFLQGKWLEEYVLQAVKSLQDEFKFSDIAINVKPARSDAAANDNFELDVAVTRGYQLFAISCMAAGEEDRSKYKEHLLEVYVRARQMGGDEARVALVSRNNNPKVLEDEIRESWFSEGRIRVFGLPNLMNLEEAMREWFKTANL